LYAGYVDVENNFKEKKIYTYTYETLADGTVKAERGTVNPIGADLIYVAYNSNTQIPLSENPEMAVRFKFPSAGGSPYMGITANHYTANDKQVALYVYVYPSFVQVSVSGYDYALRQSIYQTARVDHGFGRDIDHDLRLAFEDGQIRIYAGRVGAEESLLYTYANAFGAPRMSVFGQVMPLELIRHSDPAVFKSSRYQAKLDAQGVMKGEFRFSSGATNHRFALQVNGPGHYFYTNSYGNKITASGGKKNTTTNAWEYLNYTGSDFTFVSGTDYEFETSFTGGKMRLFIWEKGAAKPEAPVLVIDDFVETSFNVQAQIDRGDMIADAWQNFREPATARHMRLPDALSHYRSMEPSRFHIRAVAPSVTGSGQLKDGMPSELKYDSEKQITEIFLNPAKRFLFTGGALTGVFDVATGESLGLNHDISFIGNINSRHTFIRIFLRPFN